MTRCLIRLLTTLALGLLPAEIGAALVDHVTLAVTDPLGVSNSLMERFWGLQTNIRVQFHFPALVSSAPFNEPTARLLNRPQELRRQSHGIGIEFVFEGGKQSARRVWDL